MDLPKNHITLTTTQDIIDLCAPLKLLNINFFCYSRFYLDGTSISLATNTDWYQFFLAQEVPRCVNIFNLNPGYYLWSDIFPEKAVIDARNYFHIANAINFNYKEKDYIEVFTVASNPNVPIAIQTFLANIDLLEKFNAYFRKYAVNLINKAIKNKIVIPEVMRGYENITTSFALNEIKRKEFLSKIGYGNNFDYLTDREYQCLHHISRGMTMKEIAKLLNISPRTVETYLDRVKEKLNCISKSQVLEIYWESESNKITFR